MRFRKVWFWVVFNVSHFILFFKTELTKCNFTQNTFDYNTNTQNILKVSVSSPV